MQPIGRDDRLTSTSRRYQYIWVDEQLDGLDSVVVGYADDEAEVELVGEKLGNELVVFVGFDARW